MFGSVRRANPPITPARPASALPAAKTRTKIRGTSWPNALTMFGCVSDAWMMRPMRVRLKPRYKNANMPTEIAIISTL